MTTKEWLNRGWRIENEIEILQREKELAFERITSASCANDDVRVMKSEQNSSENKLINYLAYNDKIDTRIDELYQVKQEIHEAISRVQNPIFRQLLELRYLQFKRWEQIAVLLDYKDVRHVYRLHGNALKEIGEKLTLA